MEELLSYRLSDLLLFSEQTYLRQFQRYNQWLYPLQFWALLYGLAFLFACRGGRMQLIRGLALITALLWLICLYAFMYRLYAPINWMVPYLMIPLALQPLLLAAAAGRQTMPGRPGRLALLVWLSALLLPVAELASDRPVEALSAYALTPDSLALSTIALSLALKRSLLYGLPAMAWLLFSALTYVAMGSPMAWYLLGTLLLVPLALVFRRPAVGERPV